VINREQVVREIGVLVDEKPDFVYAPPSTWQLCSYAHETGDGLISGCIVGQWAHRFHGVSLDEMHRYEGKPADEVIPDLLWGVDHAALAFLCAVQHKQDEGQAWSVAFAYAQDVE